uniref:Synapse-associated protein 1 n=1 Tax=Schistocephalus solidus TaxID=70667 RepID=A0A0X3NNX1_SCHSO
MFSAIKHFIPGDWDGTDSSLTNSAKPASPRAADPERSSSSKMNLPQWNYLLSLARESTSKVAGEISSAAKELSDKFLHSAPFVEFSRAQSAFEAERTRDAVCKFGLPPWHPDLTGMHDQGTIDMLRDQILALTQDERNFLRAPPSGSSFSWDSEKSAGLLNTATTMLQKDEKLALMRFRLVPKRLKEDDFWRNYFYRISLIRQAAQLSVLANVSPEDAMYFNSAADEDLLVQSWDTSGKGKEFPAKPHTSLSHCLSDPCNSSTPPAPAVSHPPRHSPAISEDDNDDDLEAELLMELENMESKSGAGFVISDQKERDREHAKKDASGNDSVISVDDDLERELLAEIEEEEAAAAAAAADRQMP